MIEIFRFTVIPTPIHLSELLQTEQTEESLVSALMDTYDVDFTTAQADVSEFLTLLQEHHLLADD